MKNARKATMPSRLILPTESSMPTGPFLSLTMELGRLYRAAGSPSVGQIEVWSKEPDAIRDPYRSKYPVGVSHDLAARLIQGKRGKDITKWIKVHALADTLHRHRMDRGGEFDLDGLHALWQAIAHPPPVMPDTPPEPDTPVWATSYERKSPNTADHFARAGYMWARDQAGGDQPTHLQGAVALAALDPDPVACRRVFAVDFQYWLDRLADQKIFLRANVHGQIDWTGCSCVHMSTDSRGGPFTFVAVEASAFGAISVYFRTAITDGSLEDLLTQWFPAAWNTAFMAAHLMGLRGQAYGASLFPYSCVPSVAEKIDAEIAQRPATTEDPPLPIHPAIPVFDASASWSVRHPPFHLIPRSVTEVFPYWLGRSAGAKQASVVRRALVRQFPDLLTAHPDNDDQVDAGYEGSA